MVGFSFYLLVVGALFLFLYWRGKRTIPDREWLLLGAVFTGPAALLAMELGWMVTEMGRQPWTIYKYLLTRDAVTPAQWMNETFLIFSCVYLVLGITLVILLLLLAKRPKPEREWSKLIQGATVSGQPRKERASEHA